MAKEEPLHFVVTVTITDENGRDYAAQSLVLSGNRHEIERMVYYSNRNPINHYRTYILDQAKAHRLQEAQ